MKIMRVCLCFMVVEYMRHGNDVQQACVQAIERLSRLIPKDAHVDKMHSKLVVGVVAMDTSGRIGAASTLDVENRHRDRPHFPVPYWRQYRNPSSAVVHEEFGVLEASRNGAKVG